MKEKIIRAGIKRTEGYLYYIGKDGNLWRVPMMRGHGTKKAVEGRKEVILVTNVKREKGYFYFLDEDGDISKSKMQNAKV